VASCTNSVRVGGVDWLERVVWSFSHLHLPLVQQPSVLESQWQLWCELRSAECCSVAVAQGQAPAKPMLAISAAARAIREIEAAERMINLLDDYCYARHVPVVRDYSKPLFS
jgi:hypothetical protein